MVTEVRSPADWRGTDIATDSSWQYRYTPAELSRLRVDLRHGKGFGLIRGAPIDGLTEGEQEALAIDIAGHIGQLISQHGVPLKHVRDKGVDRRLATSRSYQHGGPLGYHSDPTDIVALLCIRPAREGGLSSIVSSVAVHNELLRTRPELVEVLYQPWWRDLRRGDGEDSFALRPIFSRAEDGALVADYGPDYIRSAQRGAHVPPLQPIQVAAMAELDRLTEEFAFTMDLRAGDMQFLNNHVTMHGRTAYVDDPECRRDLIRLWLDV